MKPVSLKEKMPTEKDIGITIYLAKDVFSGQTVIRSFDFMPDGDYIGVASMNPDLWFWQPVTLVSEEYLKQLEANQIKGRCKECKKAETIQCKLRSSDSFGYCSEFEPKAESGRAYER